MATNDRTPEAAKEQRHDFINGCGCAFKWQHIEQIKVCPLHDVAIDPLLAAESRGAALVIWILTIGAWKLGNTARTP